MGGGWGCDYKMDFLITTIEEQGNIVSCTSFTATFSRYHNGSTNEHFMILNQSEMLLQGQ